MENKKIIKNPKFIRIWDFKATLSTRAKAKFGYFTVASLRLI